MYDRVSMLKHKDIEFFLDNSAKPEKSYEDAVVAAVDRSYTSGRVVKIWVTAYSTKGVRWYERHFGSLSKKISPRAFEDDDSVEIGTLKIRAS